MDIEPFRPRKTPRPFSSKRNLKSPCGNAPCASCCAECLVSFSLSYDLWDIEDDVGCAPVRTCCAQWLLDYSLMLIDIVYQAERTNQ